MLILLPGWVYSWWFPSLFISLAFSYFWNVWVFVSESNFPFWRFLPCCWLLYPLCWPLAPCCRVSFSGSWTDFICLFISSFKSLFFVLLFVFVFYQKAFGIVMWHFPLSLLVLELWSPLEEWCCLLDSSGCWCKLWFLFVCLYCCVFCRNLFCFVSKNTTLEGLIPSTSGENEGL